MEVNLLRINGIQLLEHINDLGVRLLIIVMSTDSEVAEAVRAMQVKAIYFIEKPFIRNTLIEKVPDIIKQA
ncbi:MAG: two-component system response regulator FixJ [Paraglaciecola sp.]